MRSRDWWLLMGSILLLVLISAGFAHLVIARVMDELWEAPRLIYCGVMAAFWMGVTFGCLLQIWLAGKTR